MKPYYITIFLFTLFGISCSETTPTVSSENRTIQNAKKVNDLAIRNGVDPKKVHLNFEDKEVPQEEWDELDEILRQEGIFVQKNADKFHFNTEKIKVVKELTSFYSDDNRSKEENELFLKIAQSINFEKGKTIKDLYDVVITYPEIFSKELIDELEMESNK